MTTFALVLVLASAVAHATWNLFAKRSAGGVPFIWLALTLAIPIYAPFAALVLLLTAPRIGPGELAFMLGSSALHVGYFVFLQRAYRIGDLSVVYPIARGTGPVLSTAAAIAVFGERPTPLALAGAVAIAAAVFVLAGDPRALRRSARGGAIGYALLTGLTIAAYTLWDKRGVGVLLVPPLLYEWVVNVGRSLLLAPFAASRWTEVRAEWAANRGSVLAVAVLSPLAYILVLSALAVSPVSYVAPARETGILIGSLMGARVLAEGDARRRGLAAAAMVAGVIALALG